MVGALLADDELDAVKVYRKAGHVTLRVVARGETGEFYLWSHGWPVETSRQTRLRVASEVQDFVAESAFAWGQLRHYDAD